MNSLCIGKKQMTLSTDSEEPAPGAVKMTAEHVDFFYGTHQTLFDINLAFRDREVTALIGLREIDVPAVAFAHERAHRRHAAYRARSP